MNIDVTKSLSDNVFWGKTLPIIALYDSNWVLIDEWRFTKNDNFRMNIGVERIIDSEAEMEDGTMRQRIRGYRMYVNFNVNNIWNRDILMFLRKMYEASHIRLTPHYGRMQNPNTKIKAEQFEFDVLLNSDFNPNYFDNRFIGHNIEWSFKTLDLLTRIPIDINIITIIRARTETVDGVEQAEEQTARTYCGEKMIYGGWELTEEDLRYVAFVETSPDGEADPYGDFSDYI